MRKMKNSKGFTLMEMLIVVAIIAVLIAIAIPTFNASLNKAKVATDEANIRSGYASVMAEVLTADENFETEKTYTLKTDGGVYTGTVNGVTDYVCKGEVKVKNPDDAANPTVEIAGKKVNAWKPGAKVTYTVKSTGDELDVAINVTNPKP